VDGAAIPVIRQVVLDSTNPRASAEFWRQLLGLVYRRGHEVPDLGSDDRVGHEWLNLLTSDGAACLAFQGVEQMSRSTWPEPATPQQIHLDLTVANFEELESASQRVIELGGTMLYDRANDVNEPLRVFGDVDGHPFCIFVLATH
jgi:hypothetical protein